MFQAIYFREGLRPLRGQVRSYARWAESKRPFAQGVANRECDAARSSLYTSARLILAEGRRRFYGFGKALKPLLFDIRSGSLTERRLLEPTFGRA
ncbi:hypothetical protein B1F67_09450 [Pseudomonas syringae]|nr:hypothetical protein B1F67_09450 [Pseudomonas syringae]